MPYTSPATVVTGTTITSAWGNSVKAGEDFLANAPTCRVYNSASIATVTATDTRMTFNTERFDNDTMHSTVTNTGRITINTAGVYEFKFHYRWQQNATGYRQTRIVLNPSGAGAGTEIGFKLVPGNGVNVLIESLSTRWKCIVGDFVEVWCFQTSGGGLTIDAAPAYSPEFSACWESLG